MPADIQDIETANTFLPTFIAEYSEGRRLPWREEDCRGDFW